MSEAKRATLRSRSPVAIASPAPPAWPLAARGEALHGARARRSKLATAVESATLA